MGYSIFPDPLRFLRLLLWAFSPIPDSPFPNSQFAIRNHDIPQSGRVSVLANPILFRDATVEGPTAGSQARAAADA